MGRHCPPRRKDAARYTDDLLYGLFLAGFIGQLVNDFEERRVKENALNLCFSLLCAHAPRLSFSFHCSYVGPYNDDICENVRQLKKNS